MRLWLVVFVLLITVAAEPVCGDLVCAVGETYEECPEDCLETCGDGNCTPPETCNDCIPDCGECESPPVCGDGNCDEGEDCESCEEDCGECEPVQTGPCGDGICAEDESCFTCWQDCPCYECETPTGFKLESLTMMRPDGEKTFVMGEENWMRLELLYSYTTDSYDYFNIHTGMNSDLSTHSSWSGSSIENVRNYTLNVTPPRQWDYRTGELYYDFVQGKLNLTGFNYDTNQSFQCVVQVYSERVECLEDDECDDGNECTGFYCEGGLCRNPHLECGTSCATGVCENGECVGIKQLGESCSCEICDEGLHCYQGKCAVKPVCDNGVCDRDECRNCPQDCTMEDCADNGRCDTAVGENCKNNEEECKCGRLECDPTQEAADEKGCYSAFCGDGICAENEDCTLCPADCGCKRGEDCIDGKCFLITECDTDRHCDDNDPCTVDKCVSNECVHEDQIGCPLEDTCYPIGTQQVVRGQSGYCSYDETWWTTKSDDAKCLMDFECNSGECNYGECGPVSILDFFKIIDYWLKEWGLV